MRRPVKPAVASPAEYPSLEAARRILFGAALAGSLLACGGAFGDTSVPPKGQNKEAAQQMPSGGPPAPRLEGQMARPTPPCPGVPPRPQPPPPKKVEKKK